MRRQLLSGLRMTIVLIVVLGLAYPLIVAGASALIFPHQADGSLVSFNGRVVGSSLIGQSFTDADGRPLARYFQPRPSAAGTGYDATASGGSNYGPNNPAFLALVRQRVEEYRRFNGLPPRAPVPVDAVTASGSGLDPDISTANALDQAPRVAHVRGLPLAVVLTLVHDHVDPRPWGFLGEDTVNVLDLNLALDALR